MRAPSTTAIGWTVALTGIVTLFHFTDNAVNLDTYPGPAWQPDWFEWVVVLSWPAYMAVGIAAYLAHRRGRHSLAGPLLAAYSFVGLVSIGHFLYASPGELTTRGAISVFVDIAAGAVVLAMAAWTMLAHRRERVTPA